jgi:iron complex transport system permease protein
MQGLFRNPLADPSLIGVSSGAMFAATAVFVIGDLVAAQWTSYLPAAAFAGALITTIVVYRLSKIGGQTVIATMLLAGIALNALAQAGASLMTFFATDTQIRSIAFWRLGSLGGATWRSVGLIAPFVLAPTLVLPFFSKALNAFLLGESEAFHVGINVERIKNLTILLVAMAAGASVAVTGIIAFVGLIVPHVIRLATGPDYRRLLPASAMLGAAMIVGADVLARTLVVPAELPIGIITALVGAPFFLWLLIRERANA